MAMTRKVLDWSAFPRRWLLLHALPQRVLVLQNGSIGAATNIYARIRLDTEPRILDQIFAGHLTWPGKRPRNVHGGRSHWEPSRRIECWIVPCGVGSMEVSHGFKLAGESANEQYEAPNSNEYCIQTHNL